MALIFILVLTSFLGLNSITGNEPNTSITTTLSQFSNDQDMTIVDVPVTPTTAPAAKSAPAAKTISVTDYADHMSLSLAQLETVTLMLQVLDQTDGGPAPTE
jgi:hypothetical protein